MGLFGLQDRLLQIGLFQLILFLEAIVLGLQPGHLALVLLQFLAQAADPATPQDPGQYKPDEEGPQQQDQENHTFFLSKRGKQFRDEFHVAELVNWFIG